MSDTKQQCPTCGSGGKGVRRHLKDTGFHCRDPWHDSPVEGSGEPTSSGSGILEPHKDLTVAAEGQGSNRGAALPDSPSAAGSGAREWLEANCDYDDFDDDVTISRYQGHGTVEQDIPTIMESYADHCTAPLREEVAKLQDRLKTREGCSMPIMRDCPTHGESKELTAERTRREAAERDLRHYRRYVCDRHQREIESESCEDSGQQQCAECFMEAALRGKGE